MSNFDMFPALRARRRYNAHVLIALGINWSLIATRLLIALPWAP